jgi:hypothetical protein
MASAVAGAQPAISTDQAIQAAGAADQKVAGLSRQRAQIGERYQAELAAIERLKQEKASWARSRELREKLADSNDVASQLATLDKQLASAQDALAAARRVELSAIDAELAAGAIGTRAQQLGKLRTQLTAAVRAPKKIVIPDAELDPAAAPEELEAQAAQIREAEQELANEASGLDRQAKELAEVADVQKAHARSNDLARRDDIQPLRSGPHATSTGGLDTAGPKDGTLGGGNGAGSGSGASPAPGSGTPPGGESFSNDKGSSGFDSEASVVLVDVVDHATIDGLARASRSGDPGQRAEAARKARDAVRVKLDMLQKKRALIEQRARQLRK